MALVMDSIQCQLNIIIVCSTMKPLILSTIAGIKNRFNQPGHIMYKSVKNLLLNAANKTPFEEHFKQVIWIYKDYLDSYLLSA